MSLQLNELRIAGHLTRDPVTKTIGGDRSVCNFGVAINRRWKAADGTQREEVTFIDVEAWGSLADFIGKYFRKGAAIYVAGRLRLETWDDHGTKRSKLVAVADSASFVESKGVEVSTGGAA